MAPSPVKVFPDRVKLGPLGLAATPPEPNGSKRLKFPTKPINKSPAAAPRPRLLLQQTFPHAVLAQPPLLALQPGSPKPGNTRSISPNAPAATTNNTARPSRLSAAQQYLLSITPHHEDEPPESAPQQSLIFYWKQVKQAAVSGEIQISLAQQLVGPDSTTRMQQILHLRKQLNILVSAGLIWERALALRPGNYALTHFHRWAVKMYSGVDLQLPQNAEHKLQRKQVTMFFYGQAVQQQPNPADPTAAAAAAAPADMPDYVPDVKVTAVQPAQAADHNNVAGPATTTAVATTEDRVSLQPTNQIKARAGARLLQPMQQQDVLPAADLDRPSPGLGIAALANTNSSRDNDTTMASQAGIIYRQTSSVPFLVLTHTQQYLHNTVATVVADTNERCAAAGKPVSATRRIYIWKILKQLLWNRAAGRVPANVDISQLVGSDGRSRPKQLEHLREQLLTLVEAGLMVQHVSTAVPGSQLHRVTAQHAHGVQLDKPGEAASKLKKAPLHVVCFSLAAAGTPAAVPPSAGSQAAALQAAALPPSSGILRTQVVPPAPRYTEADAADRLLQIVSMSRQLAAARHHGPQQQQQQHVNLADGPRPPVPVAADFHAPASAAAMLQERAVPAANIDASGVNAEPVVAAAAGPTAIPAAAAPGTTAVNQLSAGDAAAPKTQHTAATFPAAAEAAPGFGLAQEATCNKQPTVHQTPPEAVARRPIKLPRRTKRIVMSMTGPNTAEYPTSPCSTAQIGALPTQQLPAHHEQPILGPLQFNINYPADFGLPKSPTNNSSEVLAPAVAQTAAAEATTAVNAGGVNQHQAQAMAPLQVPEAHVHTNDKQLKPCSRHAPPNCSEFSLDTWLHNTAQPQPSSAAAAAEDYSVCFAPQLNARQPVAPPRQQRKRKQMQDTVALAVATRQAGSALTGLHNDHKETITTAGAPRAAAAVAEAADAAATAGTISGVTAAFFPGFAVQAPLATHPEVGTITWEDYTGTATQPTKHRKLNIPHSAAITATACTTNLHNANRAQPTATSSGSAGPGRGIQGLMSAAAGAGPAVSSIPIFGQQRNIAVLAQQPAAGSSSWALSPLLPDLLQLERALCQPQRSAAAGSAVPAAVPAARSAAAQRLPSCQDTRAISSTIAITFRPESGPDIDPEILVDLDCSAAVDVPPPWYFHRGLFQLLVGSDCPWKEIQNFRAALERLRWQGCIDFKVLDEVHTYRLYTREAVVQILLAEKLRPSRKLISADRANIPETLVSSHQDFVKHAATSSKFVERCQFRDEVSPQGFGELQQWHGSYRGYPSVLSLPSARSRSSKDIKEDALCCSMVGTILWRLRLSGFVIRSGALAAIEPLQ